MKSQKRKKIASFSLGRSGTLVSCALGGLGLLLSGSDAVAQLGPRGFSQPQPWPWRPVAPKSPAPVAPTVPVAPVTSSAPPVVPGPTTPVPVPGDPAALTGLPKGETTYVAARKNQVSVAADVMLGVGQITVPIGYSLAAAQGSGGNSTVLQGGQIADRSSTYVGGTISYSYGQNWFLDVSYAQGDSSGNVKFKVFDPSSGVPEFNTKFTVKDDWYQVYLRYTFPSFQYSKYKPYLRAGVSYITADLEATSSDGSYRQSDATTEYRANLGAGVRRSIYVSDSGKFALGLSLEAEAFYGSRTQDSQETLVGSSPTGVTTSIDNSLYGGLGRLTLRADYLLGTSGAWKLYGDFGAQYQYNAITYPNPNDFGGTSEYLWGPYGRIGLRYNF